MFQKIQLFAFRNFEDVQLSFSPKVNIFIGENGQGKTNLLEALYVLSTGNSFRYIENENLIKKDQSEASLKAKVMVNDLNFDVRVLILKSKKNIFIQEKKATSSELIEKFPVVVFSPESLSSIKEGADQRRQLVDDLLTSYDKKNVVLISEFRKCLKMRNKVLKQYQEALNDKNQVLAVLESLNPQFIRLGTELTVQRLMAIKAVLPDLNDAMQNISKDPSVDISVEYVISGENALNFDQNKVQNVLQKRLLDLVTAELATGASLIGPQKHDIKFLYNQNDSRFYCSQGQQRALILSFKMAQIVYHYRTHRSYPVLMLDDVLSELDFAKREALISFLMKINTQIFITTTELSFPDEKNTGGSSDLAEKFNKNGSVIAIRGGKIL